VEYVVTASLSEVFNAEPATKGENALVALKPA
jgi:hypothetical protein